MVVTKKLSLQLPKSLPPFVNSARVMMQQQQQTCRFDYAAYAATIVVLKFWPPPQSSPGWPPSIRRLFRIQPHLTINTTSNYIYDSKKRDPAAQHHWCRFFQGTRMQNKPLEYIRLYMSAQFYCQSLLVYSTILVYVHTYTIRLAIRSSLRKKI